jgi:hypothetical protein
MHVFFWGEKLLPFSVEGLLAIESDSGAHLVYTMRNMTCLSCGISWGYIKKDAAHASSGLQSPGMTSD